MKHTLIIILFFFTTLSFGQVQRVVGIYNNVLSRIQVTFNPDSIFEYVTKGQHPTFYRWENFVEKGKWTLSGDTIILNPNLTKKVFVESDFKEEQTSSDTTLMLTFNHIKRYFDSNGNIIKTDTLQMTKLDYTFNKLEKKKQTRIAKHSTTRCTFAGYIPKEIITSNQTITIKRPVENLSSIFIGCYELQGTKEFVIKNKNSNYLTLNVYSNYYQDGQVRQMKFLIKNHKVLYTRRKENGEFERDNIWTGTDSRLTRKKGGSQDYCLTNPQ